jgi:hypothetical protein
MSVAKRSVQEHLNIRRPSGRIDPVIAKALKSLEEKKIKKWADEVPSERGRTLPDSKRKLEESLTTWAGTLRTATRRLRREAASDVERLLTANPALYALTLRRAVDNYEAATATGLSGVDSQTLRNELAAIKDDLKKRAAEFRRRDSELKKSDTALSKKLERVNKLLQDLKKSTPRSKPRSPRTKR